MGRVLAAVLAALVLAVSGLTIFGAPPSPEGTAGPMSLWEADSRGYITITQVDLTYTIGGSTNTGPLGFRVRSTAPADVQINEYAMLLSPNPRDAPGGATTQDGVLTKGTVPTGGTLTYGYGDFVAAGILTNLPWWCTEERQFVQSGIQVRLGGEILPFAMEPIIQNPVPSPSGTQDNVWLHLRTTPSPVVGKTVNGAFWGEIPQTAGQTLQVVLRATNLAIKDDTDAISPDPHAPTARVWDRIPAGFTLDLSSITPGYSLTTNPDGSKTISWIANLPAADVTGQDPGFSPTPYVSRTFAYRVTTPLLTPGRLILARAQVSAGNDPTPEAHSAQPVLDVFRVNLPPVANAGSGYVGLEGDTITFSAAASSDPNGDPLQYRWDLDADGAWDTAWSTNPTTSLAYGDDYVGRVRVQVSDGELTSTAEASVTVRNVDPVIESVRAFLTGDLSLRVAGSGWQDVTLDVSEGGTTTSLSVARAPGDPDEQTAQLADVEVGLSPDLAFTVRYTPMADPPSAQGWGTTSVLVVLETRGGQARLHHMFEGPSAASRTWGLASLVGQLIGSEVQLSVTALDIGSDDLTFSADWGDGTSASEIVFNNGASPDPFPSVDVNPIRATVTFLVPYSEPGSYSATLTVEDDDGGIAQSTFDLRVSSPADLKHEAIQRIKALKEIALARGDKKFVHELDHAEEHVWKSLGYKHPFKPESIDVVLGADVTVLKNEKDKVELLLGPSWDARLDAYTAVRLTWSNGVVTVIDLPDKWPKKDFHWHEKVRVDAWEQDVHVDVKKDKKAGVEVKVHAHDASLGFSVSLDADLVAGLSFTYEIRPWWVDDAHLDPKHGKKVFDEEKKAVKHLTKRHKDDGATAIECRLKEKLWTPDERAALDAECDAIANLLVKADEVLARVAIADAMETPVKDPKHEKKVQHEIDKALKELGKAYAEWDTLHYDHAIQRFKKAWEHAQHAIKHAGKG